MSFCRVKGRKWEQNFSFRAVTTRERVAKSLVNHSLRKPNTGRETIKFDILGQNIKNALEFAPNRLANDDEIEGYILEKQELLDTWEEMLILLERRVSHLNKTNKSTEVIHTRNSDSTEIKLLPCRFRHFLELLMNGVLKGDAQKIVQSLPITDGNFQIAWDLLKERYFHKREILSSLMKKLMNISPITCESHAQILKLVDSTKECVRLLETLDLKVEGTADIILMFIIQFKLDSTTRGWWERSLDNEKIPSLSELLQFLSNHARSLMTEGFDSNSQVLLCTALVNVCDSFGGTRLCRVLLDPGSQACLITSSCLERLGLPRKRTNVRISCLGASDTRTNDSIPEANLLTSEERACEDHFIDTHVRNEDGRYVVRLPFHSSPSKLGDSRRISYSEFKSLEHSLIKKPAIYSQYRDFMQEYLTLGHMGLFLKMTTLKEAYYLPHHAVLRDSSTTKLRLSSMHQPNQHQGILLMTY
ncbi:integrase catalytic domain-containing protein [Trichonephila clavipes]|nr:integrase catalytic domain-containing protein [Trichonephila clavipes]